MMRDQSYEDHEEKSEAKAMAWETLFGSRGVPLNRKDRRAKEKALASEIRRNQRAYARRMKAEEASRGPRD